MPGLQEKAAGEPDATNLGKEQNALPPAGDAADTKSSELNQEEDEGKSHAAQIGEKSIDLVPELEDIMTELVAEVFYVDKDKDYTVSVGRQVITWLTTLCANAFPALGHLVIVSFCKPISLGGSVLNFVMKALAFLILVMSPLGMSFSNHMNPPMNTRYLKNCVAKGHTTFAALCAVLLLVIFVGLDLPVGAKCFCEVLVNLTSASFTLFPFYVMSFMGRLAQEEPAQTPVHYSEALPVILANRRRLFRKLPSSLFVMGSPVLTFYVIVDLTYASTGAYGPILSNLRGIIFSIMKAVLSFAQMRLSAILLPEPSMSAIPYVGAWMVGSIFGVIATTSAMGSQNFQQAAVFVGTQDFFMILRVISIMRKPEGAWQEERELRKQRQTDGDTRSPMERVSDLSAAWADPRTPAGVKEKTFQFYLAMVESIQNTSIILAFTIFYLFLRQFAPDSMPMKYLFTSDSALYIASGLLANEMLADFSLRLAAWKTIGRDEYMVLQKNLFANPSQGCI